MKCMKYYSQVFQTQITAAMQYRHNLLPQENALPICTRCSENHNYRCTENLVLNSVLYSGAISWCREKLDHACTTTNRLYKASKWAVHILYNAREGEGGWQFVICVIWGVGVVLAIVI